LPPAFVSTRHGATATDRRAGDALDDEISHARGHLDRGVDYERRPPDVAARDAWLAGDRPDDVGRTRSIA
jgi:hypothetical protein